MPKGDDPGKRFAGLIAQMGQLTRTSTSVTLVRGRILTCGPTWKLDFMVPLRQHGRAFMVMERYVVTQEHEELWWVSHCEKKLYSYPEEARVAALALAKEAAARGIQSTVLVIPPSTDVEVHETRKRRRFSGM